MRVSCRSNVGVEGSMVICEGLVGDSSRWRSSGGRWSLQRVVACGVAQRWWQRRGLRWLLLTLLPGCGGGVSCCVRYSRALFVCGDVPFCPWCTIALLLKWYSSAPDLKNRTIVVPPSQVSLSVQVWQLASMWGFSKCYRTAPWMFVPSLNLVLASCRATASVNLRYQAFTILGAPH
jgi:hypothetical protein